MSAANKKKRENENETRDAFLARVAKKLDEQAAHAWSLAQSEREEDRAELRAVLAELLDFSRELRIIASPNEPVPLEKKEIDLAILVTNLFNERRPSLRQNGIEVEIIHAGPRPGPGPAPGPGPGPAGPGPAGPGGSVIGRFDAQHVTTMLLELTSNALKYCSAGEPVTITIEIDGEMALLVVENAGSWVGDQTSLEHFERFARGEEVRADVPGYGVGLWLTQRLAEAHDGALRVSVLHNEGLIRTIVSLPIDRLRGDIDGFSVRLLRT
jgi:signal transduction histidine kinase